MGDACAPTAKRLRTVGGCGCNGRKAPRLSTVLAPFHKGKFRKETVNRRAVSCACGGQACGVGTRTDCQRTLGAKCVKSSCGGENPKLTLVVSQL